MTREDRLWDRWLQGFVLGEMTRTNCDYLVALKRGLRRRDELKGEAE